VVTRVVDEEGHETK
jgi:hypothetical protein